MELPKHVVDKALELVVLAAQGKCELPSLIPESASFYVALETDENVLAFGGIEESNIVYKIGTMRQK